MGKIVKIGEIGEMGKMGGSAKIAKNAQNAKIPKNGLFWGNTPKLRFWRPRWRTHDRGLI